MLKNRILFVCVGQAGGNIGQYFEELGYNCLFINTALPDLDMIKGKHKFHIPGSYGCSKNREKAIEYIPQTYSGLYETIATRFPYQDIIYFIFSLGGGTGSGFSPILMNALATKTNKYINGIGIVASPEDDLVCRKNSVLAFDELRKNFGRKGNLIFINNGNTNAKHTKEEREGINRKFVSRFEQLMLIPDKKNKSGNFDISEVETILTSKGIIYMSLLPSTESSITGYTQYTSNGAKPINLAIEILNNIKRNILLPFESGKTCDNIGLLLSGATDTNDLNDLFGTPTQGIFTGYGEQFNFVIATGLPYPSKAIKELADGVNAEYATLIEEDTEKDNSPEDLSLRVMDFKKAKNNHKLMSDIMDGEINSGVSEDPDHQTGGVNTEPRKDTKGGTVIAIPSDKKRNFDEEDIFKQIGRKRIDLDEILNGYK